jgi:hypothetical protein
MTTFRIWVTFFAVLLVTLVVSNYVQPYWVGAFLNGRTFEPKWGWWSFSWLLLTWGYDVLVTLIAAPVLAVLLPRRATIWWCVGLGVAMAGIRLLSSRNYVSPDADTVDRAWIYGSYLMSVLGALLGSGIVLAFRAWRHLTGVRGGRNTNGKARPLGTDG